MPRTLLSFTPLPNAAEDAVRVLANCVRLTQTYGPIPLASMDAEGQIHWANKVVLLEGHLIQIAPVVDGEVQAVTHCFDVQDRTNAIKLSIFQDAQNPALHYIRFDPAGATPVQPLQHTTRLSNNTAQAQPVPKLQVISVRDKYQANDQSTTLEIIGTIDIRPGRNTKLVFGSTVTVWSDAEAVFFEW